MIQLLLTCWRSDDGIAQASTWPFIVSVKRQDLPLAQLLTTFFRCARAWPTHLRLGVSDASLFSFAWCRPCGRRTKHPSGSRPCDVSPAGQTSAPGTCRAPENRQFPTASNRVLRTNALAPLWVP